MTEGWLIRTADSFWEHAGGPAPFPRHLETLVGRALPLSLVELPSLSISVIEQWFTRVGVAYRFLCQNRELCGCIVAARGVGFIFVDATDDKAEQRFTIAHEIAHFLLDYLEPRLNAIQVFGSSIVPVLDGVRTATPTESIDAVLAQVPLGMYTRFMERSPTGGIDQSAILRAEIRADRLAFELLAPADQVLELVHSEMTGFSRVHALTQILISKFGLPASAARPYGAMLARQTDRQSFSTWLGR